MERVSSEIESREQELAILVEQANNAPGAMQSASDTTKSQFSAIAAQQQEGIEKLKIGLAELNKLDLAEISNSETVKPGSLAKVARSEAEAWYMLMPVGGGQKIDTDMGTVIALTVGTPLGDALTGKSKGGVAKLGEQIIQILDVI